MTFEIKITKDYNGVKPKNFLKKKLDIPFFKIPGYLRDKRITINGKKIKQETIMKTGDIIKVWLDEIKLREVESNFKEKKDLKLKVIYEDEDLLVFNKLPNVIVQGAQHNDMSLSLHLAYYKDKIKDNADFEYFHVHRLDKDTSGVLVVAKNRTTLRDLNKIFRSREIKKKYVCLVLGKPDKTKGLIEEFMKRNPEGIREKMSICNESEFDAKKSISNYKVLAEYEYENEEFSLIEVEIKTGITHQIRVHMKHLGCPILGDKMYGNSVINSKFETELNRQFLHAKSLKFEFNNTNHKFNADLTQDIDSFLKKLTKLK